MITPDDNGTFLVTFPDVPGATSFGVSYDDALSHGRDALLSMFDALMADRQAIPAASPANGRPTVALPALDAAKIALYTAMRDAKVNKAELRRRLRTHPPQVDRLLKMRHASKLDLLEQAFAAVGKRLVLSFEDLPQATTPAGARTPTRRRARGRPARVRRRHRAARA